MPRQQARPTRKRASTLHLGWLRKREAWGAILGVLSLLGALALLSVIGGAAGRGIARLLRSLFGWGAYVMVVLGQAAAVWLVGWRSLRRRLAIRPACILGLELLLLGSLGLLHSPFPANQGFDRAAAGAGGGYLGWALIHFLSQAFGRLGAVLVLVALAGLGLTLLSRPLWALARTASEKLLDALAQRPRATEPVLAEEPQPSAAPPVPAKPSARPPTPALQPAPERPPRPRVRSPRLPPLDLLAPGSSAPEDEAGTRYQAQLIEETLASFGLPVQVVDIQRGPTVTQFGVEPGFLERKHADGTSDRRKVRVSHIAALANDLALALAVPAVRIEAPVPGQPLVGIEVPNRRAALVNLRPVLESDAFRRIRSPLRIALGQDAAGQPVAADLASMPHLLIAGATGSGKSVCINALIACLLLENPPENLKLLLVDPKRVELTHFNGIPHLLAPVVVEVEQTVLALRWLCQEMDRRYKLFSRASVRHIDGFNATTGRHRGERLPYLVLFIDELADLMMVAPEAVERSICRLAQMGRATGIHLVVATQRPSVDVVTGLIKANFSARIAFAVTTQVDSRVILDAAGAEQLLGRGDMLFMAPEANRLRRIQGCFVSDKELAAIVEYWRQAVEADPDQATPTVPWTGISLSEANQEDEWLNQAVDLIRQQKQVSASFLQRRLRIGYARAARLMEELEKRGLVGPDPGGGRPRQVLATAPDRSPEGKTDSEDER